MRMWWLAPPPPRPTRSPSPTSARSSPSETNLLPNGIHTITHIPYHTLYTSSNLLFPLYPSLMCVYTVAASLSPPAPGRQTV